jgi:LysR family nod box-dependent transcriptional activator
VIASILRWNGRTSLTPQVQSLIVPVRAALLSAQTPFDTSTQLDPLTTRRVCRIVVTGYSPLAVLPPLARRLANLAPGIARRGEPLTRGSFEQLQMGDLDFCLTANE